MRAPMVEDTLPPAIMAALLLWTAPAQAQQSVAEAQAALANGEAERAVAMFDALLAQSPDDADLLRRLATAQAAAGDLDRALLTIDRARSIAPNDNDILLARARILMWQGRVNEARVQADGVRAAVPDYPDLAEFDAALDARQATGAADATRVTLSIGAALSDVRPVAGPSRRWKSATVAGAVRIDDRTTISGAIEYEKRLQADVRASMRYDRSVNGADFYAAIAAVPEADFREQWSVAAGGTVAVASDWTLLLDARYARYSTTSILAVQPGIRYRPVPGLALTAQAINLFEQDGTHRLGGALRGDYDFGDERSIFATAARYPDTEAGITRQVRSLAIGGALPIAPNAMLRVSIGDESRKASYRRQSVALGLSWRFGVP